MPGADYSFCSLIKQGLKPGRCLIKVPDGSEPACQASLRQVDGQWQRLIVSVHLSRPENYLSIYQSGCNLSCRKCHSWSFSRQADGEWMSPADILYLAREYERMVTLREPRHKATSWHAHDTCRCCGACIMSGQRSPSCPGLLDPESIRLSPQGFGPARNIVAFTGGDVLCQPEFYGCCARLIKEKTGLWLLLETNGYGLTDRHLDYLASCGVDAFWLDIKAFDPEKHRWLTGRSNEHILRLPEAMRARGFVLEVLSLYIPDLVETEELTRIADLIQAVDPETPFTILAFFPEYLMKDFRSPTVREMVRAYEMVKAAGLTRVRLGNVGIFARSQEDRAFLAENVDPGAY